MDFCVQKTYSLEDVFDGVWREVWAKFLETAHQLQGIQIGPLDTGVVAPETPRNKSMGRDRNSTSRDRNSTSRPFLH